MGGEGAGVTDLSFFSASLPSEFFLLLPPLRRLSWINIVGPVKTSLPHTVEPRFNDLRYDDNPGITIKNRLPSKSSSKMYGAEPRYNDFRYDIPGLTTGLSLTEHKIFPDITIKST